MGFALTISGWAIALAALALFPAIALRVAFVLVGIAVECLGIALLASAYRSLQLVKRKPRGVR
jgi:hypothetical protein